MKATVERRTAGWLLSLVDRSDLVAYGVSTAGLGERTDCYGVLDDSVKPYLITRLPLTGAGIGEWAPVVDPAHTKFIHEHVRQRQSYRKSRGSPPPLWLQRLLYRRDLRKVTVKVKVVALAHCSGPRQQQHVRTTGVRASLAKGLCHVFHTCTSMPFLVGYAAVVIEILLMLAGDVERNPGPVGRLSPHNLVTVLTALLDVSHKWHDIGLALRMSSGTLDSMRGPYKGPRDCMKDMLKEWLNTSPDPSWKGLMEALRHPVVGKPYLAMQLEAKYLTQGESPDGSDEPDEAASKSRKRKSSGSAPKRRVLKRHSSSSPDGSNEPDEATRESRKSKSSGGGGSAPKRRALKRHSFSTLPGPDGSDEPDEAASESRKRKSSGGGGSAPKRRVLKRHSSSSAHASPSGASTVSASPQPVTSGVRDRELTQRDLGTLTNLLSGIDWHELGLQLGISISQLKAIEEDYRRSGRRMSEMLFAWVKGTERPTVGQLEAALRSKALKEIQRSCELIEEYTTL